MYNGIVKSIECRVEDVDIFELFEFLKTLAVVRKSLVLLGEDVTMVDGLIERVQEQIIMIKL